MAHVPSAALQEELFEEMSVLKLFGLLKRRLVHEDILEQAIFSVLVETLAFFVPFKYLLKDIMATRAENTLPNLLASQRIIFGDESRHIELKILLVRYLLESPFMNNTLEHYEKFCESLLQEFVEAANEFRIKCLNLPPEIEFLQTVGNIIFRKMFGYVDHNVFHVNETNANIVDYMNHYTMESNHQTLLFLRMKMMEMIFRLVLLFHHHHHLIQKLNSILRIQQRQ